MEHKNNIITCFKNVGLSLAVDGSEDCLLKIRDLPNLTIGDWEKAPEGTKEKDENDVTTDSGVEDDLEFNIDRHEDIEDENM